MRLSDIIPVLPHARSVMAIEEVVGVFYVALVVARLVSLSRPVAKGPKEE